VHQQEGWALKHPFQQPVTHLRKQQFANDSINFQSTKSSSVLLFFSYSDRHNREERMIAISVSLK